MRMRAPKRMNIDRSGDGPYLIAYLIDAGELFGARAKRQAPSGRRRPLCAARKQNGTLGDFLRVPVWSS